MSNATRRTIALLALSGSLAGAMHATTVVPVRDSVLIDQAPLIVVATAGGSLPVVAERPQTDYLMRVDRVLKGTVGASALVVRVLGGLDPEGRELRIYGAPSFQTGARALLFLAPADDGTYRILHFLQGAFHRIQAGGRTIAHRDESQVHLLDSAEGGSRPMWLRDFDRFADWIEDRAAGRRRIPDYLFRPRPLAYHAFIEKFSFFDSGGRKLRWFNFDNGGSVTWRAHEDGQPGLAGGGFAEFQAALATWNDEPATPIRLVYGGTTTASVGFQSFDNQNVVLFKDPNQDIAGTFSCTSGGTLAIGGPWSSASNTGVFNGETFVRIQGADIVMNDGIECRIARSANPSKFIEEVFAHELGHGLGLGHASEDENETNFTLRDALMYFRAHDDGRGGSLRSDDLGGIRYLYAPSSGGGGGGGTPTCPAGNLCLLNGRFRVTVSWQNQFNNTSGAGGAVANTDLSGFFYFTDPGNIELIVKILDFGSEIKVFYSQLTNLRFTMTVLDTRSGTTKSYSNTEGECGAIEHNAFPSITTGPLGGGLDALVTGIPMAAAVGTCVSDFDTLCLLNNRFAIEVTWRNQFDGSTGVGRQRQLSGLTGAFSFTDPANLEILIKALDFGDKILVMYGSLSNFEYALRVLDTITGQVKTYQNAAGRYCGGIDENAFPPA